MLNSHRKFSPKSVKSNTVAHLCTRFMLCMPGVYWCTKRKCNDTKKMTKKIFTCDP